MIGDQKGQEQPSPGEPTIAPGMETNDDLHEEASEDEVAQGDYTEVTQLLVDRTPSDEE